MWWDEWFEEWEKEFERTFERIERMLRDAFRQGKRKEPFIYGFSVRIGPDGRPIIQEFGNVRRFGIVEELPEGFREPFTDVMEDRESYKVTIELPGVAKEDIDLKIDERSMEVKVDTASRKYYKKVLFREPVNPDTAKATYKNGVLDVVVKKKYPKEEKGKRIPIE